ncbi:GNAT family N-acetyltransferase [Mariniblastus fucicola]|uniref:Putative acetyltransferase n=1 Tax=Mariniblastus fucicola TaxID=980251 RepID=A0A5B9PA44_9BACT|nr:GNAT family N-acetyltransferase [Mariniblastus fucicola]QEG21800.1 putative acetyltransferase [Mariniblastus fucicola]
MSEQIQYRPFLNTDPPLITYLWRSQPVFRGIHANLTVADLENHILSKPYFDREGFIVAAAVENDKTRILGFVHAAFDVRQDLSDLNRSVGIVSQLRVADVEQQHQIEDRLLGMAENYLRERGSTEVWFGSRFPQAPFYLGLYGGSRVPGVMEEDVSVVEALKRNGFEIQAKMAVMQRELGQIQSVSGRQQLMVRRNYLINAIADPLEKSWWECCTLGMAERDRFTIGRKKDNHVAGTVSYWDLQPMGSFIHSNCRGLYDLSVGEDDRRGGLASFLVCESMKRLAKQGVTLVEAQTELTNDASVRLFEKLEFSLVTQGLQMHKAI